MLIPQLNTWVLPIASTTKCEVVDRNLNTWSNLFQTCVIMVHVLWSSIKHTSVVLHTCVWSREATAPHSHTYGQTHYINNRHNYGINEPTSKDQDWKANQILIIGECLKVRDSLYNQAIIWVRIILNHNNIIRVISPKYYVDPCMVYISKWYQKKNIVKYPK